MIYLATPYTSPDPAVMEARFRHAARWAADLIGQGFTVYSPICHTHPIAVYGELNQADSETWLAYDKPFMEMCDELWIVHMDGWRESEGIKREIEAFRKMDKPIRHIWNEGSDADG